MSEKEGVFDIRQADADYVPFSPFEKWASCKVDETRWERQVAELRQLEDVSADTLKRSLEIVKRAAAFDTGAIEDLYPTDRGITHAVAMQSAMWENAASQGNPETLDLFNSQMDAYDLVLDLVTQQKPIAESWIRSLHEAVCSAQDTYPVMTEVGPQVQKLPKGEYKRLPNHVRTRDGSTHSHAPVDLTPPEMHRLCKEMRSVAFEAAHPVIQASYVHHALTVVHPFADGNGRVARALASVFITRSALVSLMIPFDEKTRYLDCLEEADKGDYEVFVGFMFERALDSMLFAVESVQTASSPSPGETVEKLKLLYVTKGGYTHAQVDLAGGALMELLHNELARQASDVSDKALRIVVSTDGNHSIDSSLPQYRRPVDPVKIAYIQLTCRSSEPAGAVATQSFALVVPKDCGGGDDLLVIDKAGALCFSVRMTEVAPVISSMLQSRTEMFAKRALGECLNELLGMAMGKLNRSGRV